MSSASVNSRAWKIFHLLNGILQTSDELWNALHTAGEAEWDRFWRMPLDEEFGPQIYRSNADLCNTGGRPGGSCTAALFLKVRGRHIRGTRFF